MDGYFKFEIAYKDVHTVTGLISIFILMICISSFQTWFLVCITVDMLVPFIIKMLSSYNCYFFMSLKYYIDNWAYCVREQSSKAIVTHTHTHAHTSPTIVNRRC